MANQIYDWENATVKVSVPVRLTTETTRAEVEYPLSMIFERFARIEAALAGSVTVDRLLVRPRAGRPGGQVELLQAV